MDGIGRMMRILEWRERSLHEILPRLSLEAGFGSEDHPPLPFSKDEESCFSCSTDWGGFHSRTGKTELETAHTPNLDRGRRRIDAACTITIAPGITPGSGPAHLALFGYDPVLECVGRGVLSALGAGLEMTSKDVAARINLATRDREGRITDRRAGRISSEDGQGIVAHLEKHVRIDGVEIILRHEKEHRAVVVFRGDDLDGRGLGHRSAVDRLPAKEAHALATRRAQRAPQARERFVAQARVLLREERRRTKSFFGVRRLNPPPRRFAIVTN